jgi:hypothetical protein
MPKSLLARSLTAMGGPQLTRSDSRADGRVREVAFADQSVIIARRLAGIVMRVRVPLSSYEGVELCLAAVPGGAGIHTVGLRHRDPDLSIPLCEAADAEEITRQWTHWAQSLVLPQLVERTPDALETAESVDLAPKPRRRGSAVARRRTRFGRRRKMGTLSRLTIAYREEREIICYE